MVVPRKWLIASRKPWRVAPLPYPLRRCTNYGTAQRKARVSPRMLTGSNGFSADIVVLPFDAEDAQEAGFIRAHLKPLGIPIGNYDVLIAAQARRRELTLDTANVGEFERVRGLIVVNWTK